MNKDRRAAIAALFKEIEIVVGQVEDFLDQAETLKGEEQDYYDNMPESFQNGEKGEAASTAIEYFDTVTTALENTATELREALDALDNAGQ